MKNSSILLFSVIALVVQASSSTHHLSIARSISSNTTLGLEHDDDYDVQDTDYTDFVHDEDPDDQEGWEGIDSHGMMVFDHEISPVEQSSLIKRSNEERGPWRDVVRREVDMTLDERGIHFPRSWMQAKEMVKTVKRGFKFKGRITWYTGVDLKNPNCCDKSGFTPTDKSLIAATTLKGWKTAPKCGSYMKIRSANGKKSVIVRKIDTCGGCATGSKHVDLTKAAFSKLYSLDVGLVSNLQIKQVAKPFSKYTKAIKKIYGPASL